MTKNVKKATTDIEKLIESQKAALVRGTFSDPSMGPKIKRLNVWYDSQI